MSHKSTADEVGAEVSILEIREAPPSHFLMKIESFSLLGKNGIHKYESGEFNAGGNKWRLILDPNEDKNGIDSKYISMHLTISDTASLGPANWEINAVFSIFLLNQNSGNYHYSGGTRRFQAMKSEWGIPKFISKKTLMDPLNGFIINNTCVFGAEVFILEKSAPSECLSIKNVITPYTRNWKISNFSTLGNRWTSEKFVVEGLTWEVKLFPKGNGSEEGRWLGVFLNLVDSRRVKACFSICVKDQNNTSHVKKTDSSHWFPPSEDWGWNKFIKLADLGDPEKGFIVKDCCLLEIELSVQAVV